jgi:tetratricopeptide (TPR) repeat protein
MHFRRFSVALAIGLVLWLVAAARRSQAGENKSLRFHARVASKHGGQDLLREVRRFCSEHGWAVTTHRGQESGRGVTRIRFRVRSDPRWREIRVFDSGVVEGAFDTLSANPLLHVRLVNVIDRLGVHVANLTVADETAFYEQRDPRTLRQQFQKARTLLSKVVADAFRRGQEVTAGGKLYTEVPLPARRAYLLALEAIERGDIGVAKRALDHAIGLFPEHARAHVLRAELMALLGDHASAREDANAAIRVKPSMAAGYRVRARALVALGRQEDALQDLDRAVSLEPAAMECRLLRGLLHLRMDRPVSALEDLEVIGRPLLDDHAAAGHAFPCGLTRQATVGALEALGRCYRSLGMLKRQARVARAIRELGPCQAGPERGFTREALVSRDLESPRARIGLENDSVVISLENGLEFEPPRGWQLEAGLTDPRILARMSNRDRGFDCRIGVMDRWGRIDDPSFRRIFGQSVLKGLSLLGGQPKLVEEHVDTENGFRIFRVLVRTHSDRIAHCWVACFHHADRMITVYLSAERGKTEASERALIAILRGIRVQSKKGP